MEDKVLERMKKLYVEQKSEIEEAKKAVNRILELEETSEEVKEYLKLKELYDVDAQILKYTNDDIIYETFRSCLYQIKATNGIYVCLGSFITNHIIDIEHGSNDYRVPRSNPKAEYRLYQNIEDSYDTKRIPIKMCDEFEKTHKVIIVPYLNETAHYYNIQREFFKDCILENQEVAVEKILKKKKSKY